MKPLESNQIKELLGRAEACFKGGKITPSEASPEFLSQLVRVYFDGFNPFKTKTLQTLADALENGLKPTQISRLLELAAEKQLVKLEFSTDERLSAQKLTENFKQLKNVRICAATDKRENLFQNLSLEAAKVFDDLVHDMPQAIVAMAGGWTLFEMVQKIKRRDCDITVAPLTLFSRGGVGSYSHLIDAPFIAMALAWKLQCYAAISAIPPMAEGEGQINAKQSKKERGEAVTKALGFARDLFDMCSPLKEVFINAGKADIVFCTAASLDDVSYFGKLYKNVGVELADLQKENCVGHLNFSAINDVGDDVSASLLTKKISPPTDAALCHPFLAALSVDYFKERVQKGKDVVLVAGGRSKFKAIRAVLRGCAANYLVTDEDTAEALIRDP